MACLGRRSRWDDIAGGFIQLHGLALRRRLVLAEKKYEQRPAHFDFVTASQRALFDRKIVDVGPIDAAEVEDLESIAFLPQQRVSSG